MNPSSTKSIYDKLFVYIGDYMKSKTSVFIVYKLVYLDDETTFPVNLEIQQDEVNKKAEYFLKKGFKSIKKDIKDWVKVITDNNTDFIGKEYKFSIDDLN